MYINIQMHIHLYIDLSLYISHMYFTKWFYHSNIVTVIGKPGTPLIASLKFILTGRNIFQQP